jgi:hypothetical protein
VSASEQGFIQEYVAGQRQELFIYCRLCRRIFPVVFKPRPTIRLRCTCGHEAPLVELDVFKSEKNARAHAALYEKIYQAAKSALREAGLQLPPSGKFRQIDIERTPKFASADTPLEDESDIRSSYVGPPEEESDFLTPERVSARLEGFGARLDEVQADPFARHEVLTELLEWAFCRRHQDPRARERFLAACEEDMDLAGALVAKARDRLRQSGERVRLTFSSFKHLAIVHEEDDDLASALAVVERAAKLGLKGYAEKADELRRRLG